MVPVVPACDGGDDCCKDDAKCGPAMGDCDTDAHCDAGLTCGTDNCCGATFEADDDCCFNASAPVLPCPTLPPPTLPPTPLPTTTLPPVVTRKPSES